MMNLAIARPRQRDLLELALDRVGIRGAADSLFARYPTLRTVSSRLARYLSDLPRNPSSGRAIIDIAIEQALTCAYAAPEPDPRIYLQRLVNAATMVLAYEIRDGEDTWNPVGSSSLDQWLEAHPNAVIRPTTREVTPFRSADYRQYLASRLLTSSDLASVGVTIDAVATAPN